MTYTERIEKDYKKALEGSKEMLKKSEELLNKANELFDKAEDNSSEEFHEASRLLGIAGMLQTFYNKMFL